MALSQDLVSQFAKLANDEPKKKSEETVRGTFKTINGEEFVQIDGSDIWTPVTSTVEAETGERVTVLIKDHSATVTGNITSPTARSKTVTDLKDEVDEYGNTIKQMDNTITQQGNSIIQIDNAIKQQGDTINSFQNVIDAQGNSIQALDNTIKAQGNTITSMNNTITSQGNQITSINNTVDSQGNTINAQGNQITSIDNTVSAQGNTISAHGASINILNSGFVIEDGVLTGLSQIIVDDIDAKYANIDFANIGEAAIEKLFSDSGIIKDLIVSEGHITGELVGVTIKGDLIEGNTVKADKLVVKGSDGLYYKLNVNGETVEAEQTNENSLNGSIITAKSITATKIQVDDLVAFGATIGGFHITDSSLYSGVKSSVDNMTKGIYLDKNGQTAIGDSSNYIKYYKTEDNTYKLSIAAESIRFGVSGKTVEDVVDDAVNEIEIGGRNLIVGGSEWISDSSGTEYDWGKLGAKVEVTYGETYTLSSYYNNEKTTSETHGYAYAYAYKNDGSQVGESDYFSNYSGPDTKTIDNEDISYLMIYIGVKDYEENDSYKVKFEKGNKATDWSPAPEDVDTEINAKISNVDVEYYLSTSSTSLSGGSWVTIAPTWVDGKYMWSRTKITDGSGNVTYSPSQNGTCIAGAKGATGAAGKDGTNGKDGTSITIKSTAITYQASTSGTTTPTGTWSTTVPSVTNGQYLWTKTVVTYSDNTSTTAYSVAYKGTNGTNGNNGTNGTNAYTHIRYSASSDGSNFDTNPSGKNYIGIYNGTSSTAPTDKAQYTWSKYVGNNGTNGTNGTNGKDGNGISSITYYYATSTTQTAPSAANITSTTIPALSETNKYLWQKEIIDFTDSTVADKTSVLLIAVYGDKGNTGNTGATGPKGEDGKTYYTWVKYADSPTTGMSDNPSGKTYIGFAYNKTTSTESTNYNDYSWSLIKGDKGDTGATGSTGSTGNGIKSIDYFYAITTSQTAPAASNITSTTIPTLDATNKYLWQKEVINYTATSTPQTTVLLLAVYGNTGSQGPKGDTGNTGATGTGISSITEEYYLSTSKTTQSGGSWVTTPPTWSSGNYIWTRSKIIYSNPTSTVYTTPVCSSEWEAVNEVDIGGRNLTLNSSTLNFAANKLGGYEGSTSIVEDSSALSGNHFEVKCTTAGTGFYSAPLSSDREEPGKTITYSFWAKCSVAKSGSCGYERGGQKDISLTTEWQYFTHTFVANSSSYYAFTWYWNWSVNEILYIKDFKTEYGTKATDWTPAPEDVDSNIEAVSKDAAYSLNAYKGEVSSTLENNYLKTETANDIYANKGVEAQLVETNKAVEINQTEIEKRLTTEAYNTDIADTKNTVQNVKSTFDFLNDGLVIRSTATGSIHSKYTSDGMKIVNGATTIADFTSTGTSVPQLIIGDLTDNESDWHIFERNNHLTFSKKL